MSPRIVLLVLLFAAVLGTVAGCRPVTPTGGPIEADPAPLAGDPQPPTLTPRSGAPVTAFAIRRPVREGDTVVRGSGPAGVPVLLVDVTFMGQNLAQTVIGPEGTFELTLQPLEKNHRIGLMLGDLTGTAWSEAAFQDPAYNGTEAMQVPQVGFLFDTVLVEPG
jgi:hypothetical protein